MRIDPLEYRRPETLEEALALVGERGPKARVLGGGTDLVARLKLGILSPETVIDVSGIAELKSIREEAGCLSIGAAASLRSIEESPLVAGRFPALATAAAKVASYQIRGCATLGGNVCLETMCWYYNQSRAWKKSRPLCFKAGGEVCHVVNKPGVCYATYRGDTAISLVALGAEVRIRSSAGERIVPLEAVFTGDGKTPLGLAPAEMITEVRVPVPPAASGNAYRKISHRNAVDYPQVGVAAAVALDPRSRACVDARIVLGAVDSKPVRALKAEELLRGKEPISELLAQAAEAAAADARPVNNMTHGSPAYRRKMVRVLGLKALTEALEHARQERGDR